MQIITEHIPCNYNIFLSVFSILFSFVIVMWRLLHSPLPVKSALWELNLGSNRWIFYTIQYSVLKKRTELIRKYVCEYSSQNKRS